MIYSRTREEKRREQILALTHHHTTTPPDEKKNELLLGELRSNAGNGADGDNDDMITRGTENELASQRAGFGREQTVSRGQFTASFLSFHCKGIKTSAHP